MRFYQRVVLSDELSMENTDELDVSFDIRRSRSRSPRRPEDSEDDSWSQSPSFYYSSDDDKGNLPYAESEDMVSVYRHFNKFFISSKYGEDNWKLKFWISENLLDENGSISIYGLVIIIMHLSNRWTQTASTWVIPEEILSILEWSADEEVLLL